MERTDQKRGYLLEDFRLFHMRDIPKERVEYHYHEFYKLLIVLSGTGRRARLVTSSCCRGA